MVRCVLDGADDILVVLEGALGGAEHARGEIEGTGDNKLGSESAVGE